jgi:hypothetical protein
MSDKYIPTTFHVQTGDIITSKKGILQHSPITKKYYLVKKLKVIGSGYCEVIGDKEEITVTEEKPTPSAGEGEK